MRWSCDRTGFPVLELSDVQLAVHLWPVSKVQFERYLAEPAGPGDEWYERILAISPRASTADVEQGDYESLLMTAIQPAEAQRFAQWLGSDYNLPTTEVWRTVDRALMNEPFTADDARSLAGDGRLSRPARKLLDCWLRLKPKSWGHLALLRGGVLEWVVTVPKSFGGLGAPRPQFYSVIVNPQRDRPVQPIRDGRHKYFGFRLVRPLTAN